MRPLTRVSLSFLFLVSVEAASKKPKPTVDGLYIVREFFSDNGPSWYYHIVDVKFENGSSVIQHIRIAPMDLMCRGMVVQAGSVTLSETSGSTLLGGTDLCSMDEKEVKRALNRATLKNKWIFDTAQYGIVAKCGADERIFQLPFTDVMNFKRLKAASPQVEGLYDLFSDVVKRSFGKSPFNDVPAETERKTFQDGKTGRLS